MWLFFGVSKLGYIERINLTFRTCLARLVRKGMNYSKKLMMHSRAIDFFHAWYNFVKPHKSHGKDAGNGRGTRRSCMGIRGN